MALGTVEMMDVGDGKRSEARANRSSVFERGRGIEDGNGGAEESELRSEKGERGDGELMDVVWAADVDGSGLEENGDRFPRKLQLSPEVVGLLYMVAASLFLATNAMLARMGTKIFPTLYLPLSRAFFLIPTSLMGALLQGENPLGPPAVRHLLVLRGVIGCIGAQVADFACKYLPLADFSVLTFTGPVMTIFLAAFVLGEAIESFHLISAVVSFVGVVLIVRPESVLAVQAAGTSAGEESDRILGDVLALACAATMSVVVVIIRKIGPGVHYTVMMLYWGVAHLFVVPLSAFASGQNIYFLPSGSMECSLVFGLGITSFLSLAFLTKALQCSRAGPCEIVRHVQILFSFLLGFFVLNERPHPLSVIGAMIILLATGSLGVVTWMRGSSRKHVR